MTQNVVTWNNNILLPLIIVVWLPSARQSLLGLFPTVVKRCLGLELSKGPTGMTSKTAPSQGWQLVLVGSRELSEDVSWSLSGVSEQSLGFHGTVAAFWEESWQQWKKEAETAHPLTGKAWNWSSVLFCIFYWGHETQVCPDWSR